MSKKKSHKKKKKFWKKALFLFLGMSVVGTIFVQLVLSNNIITQYPDHTSIFYVEDYSGVFTEETERFILEQAVALQEETKAQIVVVAVPDTHADNLENYSYELANGWGIGDEELDNGVLILFTTTEPHVRLEVGRGLEGCLPDAKSGRILDTWAVDAKDSGRWNEAAINTFVAVAQEVYAEYGIEAPSSLAAVESASEVVEGTTMADADFPEAIVEENTNPLWMQILVSFVVSWTFMISPYLVICLAMYFAKPGSLVIVANSDHYDRGGFGGGSGGGFSGGGGSFGGGGASR